MTFSRRHFFYGALLAGAVPRGGFGSTPSLKTLGYSLEITEDEYNTVIAYLSSYLGKPGKK